MAVENFEQTLLDQNPELSIKPGDVAARFKFRTKGGDLHMVVEVGPEMRKKLLQTKLKMRWLICSVGDYLMAKRCNKCNRFNHRHQECKGEETCPLCAGRHSLKDCKTPANQHKCINCMNCNRQSKKGKVSENHSSLSKDCQSLQAVLTKYIQNRLLAMATLTNRDIRSAQRTNSHMGHTHIKCLQLNLQHSQCATYNLTEIILQNNIDVAFLQEPYTVLNNVAGFPKSFKIFAYGNGRKRAAIIVNNNKIDAVAIKQVSDEDATVIEFSYKGLNFYGASLYFAIDRDLGRDIGKVEEIRKLTRGKGLILSIYSNSQSKLRYDTHTKQRGKNLEEFIITSDLFLINEETEIPTFETIRGRSWIDLTLCNNILEQKTRRWTCGENKSCPDHTLIRFDIEAVTTGCNAFDHTRKRYHIKAKGWGKFENKLASKLLTGFGCANIYGDLTKCDEELGEKVKQSTNTEELMSKFTSIITATCDAAFKVSRVRVRDTKGKSVPWWTSELTILRKRALALRRRYQRTRHDDNLRQDRKLVYEDGKRHYQAKLQEEKFKYWKDFCSRTADSNPWNMV